MESLQTEATLWSVIPSGIVSQGQTAWAFKLCLFPFQKALY
jgi:hypothetical protein